MQCYFISYSPWLPSLVFVSSGSQAEHLHGLFTPADPYQGTGRKTGRFIVWVSLFLSSGRFSPPLLCMADPFQGIRDRNFSRKSNLPLLLTSVTSNIIKGAAELITAIYVWRIPAPRLHGGLYRSSSSNDWCVLPTNDDPSSNGPLPCMQNMQKTSHRSWHIILTNGGAITAKVLHVTVFQLKSIVVEAFAPSEHLLYTKIQHSL